MEDEKIIVVSKGELNASTELNANLNTEASFKGNVNATVAENVELNGSISIDAGLNGSSEFRGTINAENRTKGASNGTLTLRIGQDGANGKDGFSPTITVEKDTKTEYILRITDVNGSYLTPNLYPDLNGLQDVPALVASKVDKDLSGYGSLSPTRLNTTQRNNVYLYVNALGTSKKITLNDLALREETEERIFKKLRTVSSVPSAEDWKIGDYILLDSAPQEEKNEEENNVVSGE